MVRIQYFLLAILVVFFAQDVNAVTDEQFEVRFMLNAALLELSKEIPSLKRQILTRLCVTYGSFYETHQYFHWDISILPYENT